MTIRPPKFEVAPDDPFNNDTLGRQRRIAALCSLIMDQEEAAAVVSVSGGFGTGKSVFLKMCAAHLQLGREDVSVVEFDAWQQSHTNSPLVDLISAVAQDLPEASIAVEIAVKIVRRVGRNLLERLVEVATSGVLSLDLVLGEDDTSGVVFSAWDETERRVSEFKDALAGSVADSGGHLVVFIDELDRCLPEYAMELLNTTRHLFDVPGVVIVLGVNRTELGHRVQKVYGPKCDPDAYLRRFVDLSIDLGRPEHEHISTYMWRVLEDAQVPRGSGHGGFLGAALRLLAAEPDASMRDIEQMAHRVSQLLPARQRMSMRDQAIITMMVLHSVNRNVYKEFAAGSCDAFAAAAALRKGLPDACAKSSGSGTRILREMINTLLLMGDLQGRSTTALSESDFQTRFKEARLGDTDQAQRLHHGTLDLRGIRLGGPGQGGRRQNQPRRLTPIGRTKTPPGGIPGTGERGRGPPDVRGPRGSRA